MNAHRDAGVGRARHGVTSRRDFHLNHHDATSVTVFRRAVLLIPIHPPRSQNSSFTCHCTLSRGYSRSQCPPRRTVDGPARLSFRNTETRARSEIAVRSRRDAVPNSTKITNLFCTAETPQDTTQSAHTVGSCAMLCYEIHCVACLAGVLF